MSVVVTLKINDQDVSGRDDQTVLEVAREHGFEIPTLCHVEGLSDLGGCRLCLVEIRGVSRLLPACTTYVREGQEIYTETERLKAYRLMTLEMLFAEGNHVCAVCVSNGHCELQTLAARMGMYHVRVPYRYPKRRIDATHERFILDQNRCILCTRCVRVCEEIEGAHTWDLMGRGIDSCVITDLNVPWGSAESCTSCGKCVQVCPTGALTQKGKSVAEMTKRREFLPYLSLKRKNGKNGNE